ncbi:MAG: diacylglycerol kinase family protein [Balneolales bacterium]
MGSSQKIKIGAVINEASGILPPDQARERLEEIRRYLEKWVSPDCLAFVSGAQVRSEVERLISLNINVLVMGGGDGTISTAARLLCDSQIALAVVGLGTQNNFARDLGVSMKPVEAIGLLNKMNVQCIDLGEVNGHLFINNATIGLYPQIVEERERRTKKRGWRKWRAQIAAALIVLWRVPSQKLKVTGLGDQNNDPTPFLFVGNNEYQGGFASDSKRPALSGGCLWLCKACATGRWGLLRMAWHLRMRGIGGIQDIETLLVKEATVHSRRRKLTVAVDGENRKLHTPLRFRSRPKSLRVVVP